MGSRYMCNDTINWLSIYSYIRSLLLSIHPLSISTFIHHSIYPSIIYSTFIHHSIYPSIYLFHLSIYPSIYLFYIHPSLYLFMYTCTYIYSLFSSLTVSHTGVISLAWILYTHSCKVQKQLKDTRETHIKNYRHRLLHLGEKWNDIKQRHRVVVHIPSKGMYLIFKGNSCSPCLSLEKCS